MQAMLQMQPVVYLIFFSVSVGFVAAASLTVAQLLDAKM